MKFLSPAAAPYVISPMAAALASLLMTVRSPVRLSIMFTRAMGEGQGRLVAPSMHPVEALAHGAPIPIPSIMPSRMLSAIIRDIFEARLSAHFSTVGVRVGIESLATIWPTESTIANAVLVPPRSTPTVNGGYNSVVSMIQVLFTYIILHWASLLDKLASALYPDAPWLSL